MFTYLISLVIDMLVTLLLQLLIFILEPIIELLPAYSENTALNTAIDSFFEALHYADLVLPMDDLKTIALLFLATEMTIMGFWIANFIYNKFRGSG